MEGESKSTSCIQEPSHVPKNFACHSNLFGQPTINRWLDVLHTIYNLFSCSWPFSWRPLSCRPVCTWPFFSYRERCRWRCGLICHGRSLCCIRSAAATGSRTAAARTRTAAWGQRFCHLRTKINYHEYLSHTSKPQSWVSTVTQPWGGSPENRSLIPSGAWIFFDDHKVQNKFQCPPGIISNLYRQRFPQG
jgi:hypothetical protein